MSSRFLFAPFTTLKITLLVMKSAGGSNIRLIPSLLLKAYGSTLKAQVTHKRLRAAVINAWRRRVREKRPQADPAEAASQFAVYA
jgi:hypothetical protein